MRVDPTFLFADKKELLRVDRAVVVEIYRYIVRLGQPLAVEVGDFKIKQLRAYAPKDLGANIPEWVGRGVQNIFLSFRDAADPFG
jgi:hypothetical protein